MDERTLARFMSKVEVQPNGCWHWTGKLNRGGYGYFWFEGKSRLAHRFAYQQFVGPIPDGYEVDHRCHTQDTGCVAGTTCPHRACVNPDPEHLEAVTCYENIMRSRGVAVENANKTHCDNGHPFDDENTYVYPNGERACRTCRSSAVREWTLANRPATQPHGRDKTHCKRKHEFTTENTHVNTAGKRVCITCRRDVDREAKRVARAVARQAQTAA